MKAKNLANAEEKAKLKKRLEQETRICKSDATKKYQDRNADPVMTLAMKMADRIIDNDKRLLCTTKYTHEKFLCILVQ